MPTSPFLEGIGWCVCRPTRPDSTCLCSSLPLRDSAGISPDFVCAACRSLTECQTCHELNIGLRSHSLVGRGMLVRMCKRLAILLLLCLALSACDGYIEEIRIEEDGTVDLSGQTVVVCTDDLSQAIWGGDPCEQIDEANRSGEIGDLPFGFELDPSDVGLVVSGELDRRTIDITWAGQAGDMPSLLASGGVVRQLNDEEIEVSFSSRDTPFVQLESSDDPNIVDELISSRWEPAQFRINAPDLVIEHNGDDIQGRIVIWEIDGDEPDEFRLVFTSADPPTRWWWWIGISILFFVVLGMMIVLEARPSNKPRKKPKADASSASAGT